VLVPRGFDRGCAVFSNGTLKCWGGNEHGELGLGDHVARGDEPNEMGAHLKVVDVGTDRTVREVTMGLEHTCAILDDNTLKCWGVGYLLGQQTTEPIGDDPTEMGDALSTVDLGTGRTVKNVAAGFNHTCAILDDNALKCWGLNDYGQLGTGDSEDRGYRSNEMGDALKAVDLGPGRTAKRMALGGDHSCAILDDDNLKCWGRNDHGQLGLGDRENRGDSPSEMGSALPAVQLGSGLVVDQVGAGLVHTCALLRDNSVKCWGYGVSGQLGAPLWELGIAPDDMGDNLPKVNLGGNGRVKNLFVGGFHNCAILDDDSIKCWGDNEHGGLGIGDNEDRGNQNGQMGDALPSVDLGQGRRPRHLAVGRDTTCALLDDRTVKCWGRNDYGQLGLGDTSSRGDEDGEMGDDLPPIAL
jgi:alpha-tubulin suppressor-like RCC1 family protein